MIWLEVLVEGVSDAPTVKEVLERKFLLIEGEHFRIHPHRGKGKLPGNPLRRPDPTHQGLLDQLPAKLTGYGKSLPTHGAVLVVVDVDKTPCVDLLNDLKVMLNTLPSRPKTLFRLAIEETESWFLADTAALQKAYPGKVKKKILRGLVPDTINGASETLARALGFDLKLAGRGVKSDWARKIAPHLDLDNPPSPSFKKFIDGVSRLVAEGKA
jgi:hypothetical protein